MTAPVTVQWFARTAGRESPRASTATGRRLRTLPPRHPSLFLGTSAARPKVQDHQVCSPATSSSPPVAATATHARNVTGISGILGEYLGDTFAPKAMPGAYIGELLDKCPIIEGSAASTRPASASRSSPVSAISLPP